MPIDDSNQAPETTRLTRLVNIFINPKEKRIRSLGRILIFTIILVLSVIVFTLAINLLIALIFSSEATDLNSEGLFIIVSLLQMMIMPLSVVGTLWVMAKFIDKRKIVNYGLNLNRTWWIDLIAGVIIAMTMVTALFGFELSAGWVHVVSTRQNNLLPLNFGTGLFLQILSFIPIIFFEEIGLRGYLGKNICEGLAKQGENPWFGVVAGLILTSTIIAISNAGNFLSNWIHIVLFIISLCFIGLIYFFTGQLGLTIGMHLGWLIFQGAVFGFKINGVEISNSIITTYTNGPVILTGGNFEPLGGVTGVIFTMIGAIIGFLYIKWSKQNLKIDLFLPKYQNHEENSTEIIDSTS